MLKASDPRIPVVNAATHVSLGRRVRRAALSFDCMGTLYAVTGANGVGETFVQPSSLLRINPTSGAAVTVCTFTSTERVQVGAFGTSTTFVHFYGTSPPRMETLSLSGQSGVCKTRCVSMLAEGPCAGVATVSL
jgi:hypothetical protein